MPRRVCHSARDLRTHVDDLTDNCPDRTAEQLDRVVARLQADPDRPAWGSDFGPYLDQFDLPSLFDDDGS